MIPLHLYPHLQKRENRGVSSPGMAIPELQSDESITSKMEVKRFVSERE